LEKCTADLAWMMKLSAFGNGKVNKILQRLLTHHEATLCQVINYEAPIGLTMQAKFLIVGLFSAMVANADIAEAASIVSSPAPLSSTEKNIESVGTATAIALPLFAGGISVYQDDWVGVAQLIEETGLTVGTSMALKQFVREERPNGSDFSSFPSNTTALAASGSSYLWGRYGWEYGLPALAATEFVAYSRVQAKEHHWYDTLASTAIAAGYGYVITTRFRRYNIYTDLDASPSGASVRFLYKF
jgi:membrane-associated phospholipid phosphatase